MNKTIIGIATIVVFIVGGYFLSRGTYSPTLLVSQPSDTTTIPQQQNPEQPENKVILQPSVEEVPTASKAAVITYTDEGYSPATVQIKQGETVIFKNQSSKSMWPASAMHPSHRVYGGTSLSEHCPDTNNSAFDACTGILPGESWSFKFGKVGTWKYHDHLTLGYYGTIVVE